MRGIRSADLAAQVETFAGLDDLPDDATSLFDSIGSFFATRVWWEIVLAHAVPLHAMPRLVLVRQAGRPCGLFPMHHHPASGELRALTTPYSCLYEPLIAPDVLDRAEVFATFARYCRRFPTTRLDALDSSVAVDFANGGKRAGLSVARFDHFGNWHDEVSAPDWAGWLARRPGALRETIRRRSRRAAQLQDARFRLFEHNDLAGGVDAFESVYARSWKQPEPHAAFNPAQIRAAGSLGLARIGVWWIGETPVAAQFWIVEGSCATVLKLAHDEAFKEHSPGTVLTAWMIRHLIEQEHVTELDFGRGDDPYKRDWVGCRRQRVGVMLINRGHPRGMLALVRHRLGRITAKLRHD